MPKFNYSDKEIERLLERIYKGEIDPATLPEDLYFATAKYLEEGVYKGFKNRVTEFEFGSPDRGLLEELRDNIYIFSAAKTHQQVKDLVTLLTDEEGAILPFREFKKQARKVYEDYNVNYLEAEYNTAIGQAQTARKWQDIQADKSLFKYLRYNAVMDANTSTICRPLEGITLPVEDPFWDTHSPLNHYNCRCVFDKIDKYEAVEITPPAEVKIKSDQVSAQMDDVFKMNPGKDRVIFNKKHPYFDIEPKYKPAAEENFNLPIPEIVDK